jgi:hypothetical protein
MCVFVDLVVAAAILGIVIALMEQAAFPGWGKTIVCVLAAIIPTAVINAFLPAEFFFVGLAVGALCAGLVISAVCGMSVKRAILAAAIYLAIQTVISFGFYLMMRAR